MIRHTLAALALVGSAAAMAREPAGLHETLSELARDGRFSGAVVVRGADGVRFARGYGLADPFNGRRFTPDTPVDSGSLAKPVTSAAILALATEGKLALDRPARAYLPDFWNRDITVRHLLSHSAGLTFDNSPAGLAGKLNRQLIEEMRSRPLLFPSGTGFNYCNGCAIALAEIIERVSGRSHLAFARSRLELPAGVSLRPARLSDWAGRAIGYRREPTGQPVRFDSWEGERLFGPANLSISAAQLAQWGSRWWRAPLAALRPAATDPALIAGNRSGLTIGNWYCATGGRRCHYLGHHEGFHHMLYWDVGRRLSIAMVSNNSLSPAIQQPLQRALVAFAEGRPSSARRELASHKLQGEIAAGRYRLPRGELIVIDGQNNKMAVERAGLRYPAYPVGGGIRYVPGLDVYLTGQPGGLGWLGLYEDHLAIAAR